MTVIAMSREIGSLGNEEAARLAKRLGITPGRCLDRYNALRVMVGGGVQMRSDKGASMVRKVAARRDAALQRRTGSEERRSLRCVLKLICTLLLICFAASLANAGDSRGMLRDRLLFSSQFMIEEPDTTLIRDFFADDCCFNSQMSHSSVLHPSGPPVVQDYVLINPKGEVPSN
jgi:hypothetical protein